MLFSVVIPTYNRSARLSEAVQSILMQSYPHFEIIVVDDGGSDDTRNVLDSFGDNRIRYFWKPNEERSIARNFGIDKSTGEYICFLDSDDYWHENHLSEAVRHLQKTQPPVFHSSYQYAYEDGQKAAVIVKDVSLQKVLANNFLHLNAVAIRRDVLDTIRFIRSKDAMISEDYFLWLNLAAQHPFVCSAEVTTSIVEHGERSLNNVNPDKAAKSFETIIAHLDAVPVFASSRYKGAYKKYKASRYLLLALFYAVHSRPGAAMPYLTKALRLHPLFLFSRRFAAIIKKMILK